MVTVTLVPKLFSSAHPPLCSTLKLTRCDLQDRKPCFWDSVICSSLTLTSSLLLNSCNSECCLLSFNIVSDLYLGSSNVWCECQGQMQSSIATFQKPWQERSVYHSNYTFPRTPVRTSHCKIVVQHAYFWVVCFKQKRALGSTGCVSYLPQGWDQTSDEQLLRAGKVYFCLRFEGPCAAVEKEQVGAWGWYSHLGPSGVAWLTPFALFIQSRPPANGSCYLVQGGWVGVPPSVKTVWESPYRSAQRLEPPYCP